MVAKKSYKMTERIIGLLYLLATTTSALGFYLLHSASGIGGSILCYLLYTASLIPGIISVLSIIGYILLLSRSPLNIVGYSQGFIMFLPVALFELIFPIWIIAKGLNSTQLIIYSNDK
jgi:hypothetical protein